MKLILFFAFFLIHLGLNAQSLSPPIRSCDTAKIVAYYQVKGKDKVIKQLVWLSRNVTNPLQSRAYSFEEALEYSYRYIDLVLFSDGVYACYFNGSGSNSMIGHYRWEEQSLVLQVPHLGREKPSEVFCQFCNSPFIFNELVFSEQQLFSLYQPATTDSFHIDFYINQKYKTSTFYKPVEIKCFRNDSICFQQKGLWCDSMCRLSFHKNFKIDSFQITAAFGFFSDCEYVFKNTTFYFPANGENASIAIFRIETPLLLAYYHNLVKWDNLYKTTHRQFIKVYGLPTFRGDEESADRCALPPLWSWPVQKEKKIYALTPDKDILIAQHWKGYFDFARILARQPIPPEDSEFATHPIKRFLDVEQNQLSKMRTDRCD